MISAQLEAALEESAGMSSKMFCEVLKRLVNVGPFRYLECDPYNKFSRNWDAVIITFANANSSASGAEFMNNRALFSVEGFGRGEGDPSPSGKVKVKPMSNAYAPERIKKLRGKTGKPEAIAKYVASYIKELMKLAPE